MRPLVLLFFSASTMTVACEKDPDCPPGSRPEGLRCVVPDAGHELDCAEGWADCDERAENGCEADLQAGTESCGECGYRCADFTACLSGICLDERAIDVGVGMTHACALLRKGSVYCWGDNAIGQLGNGGAEPSETPALVEDVAAIALSVAAYSSCTLTGDARVVCWGSNESGNLGDGTTIHRATAVQAPLPTIALAVSAAGGTTCAIVSGGEVFCWGDLTGPPWTLTPSKVEGLPPASSIATGVGHSCAIAEGRLYCWGANHYGQIGDGTLAYADLPTEVDLPEPASVVAGQAFTCARQASGEVWCWGDNTWGSLGDGTVVSRSVPGRVTGLADVAQLAAGHKHACAVRTDGRVACWGPNVTRSVSPGSGPDPVLAPRNVDGVQDARVVGTGGHSCAVDGSGRLYCWGGVFIEEVMPRLVEIRPGRM